MQIFNSYSIMNTDYIIRICKISQKGQVMTMDIAGLSMAMSSAKTNDAYGVAMLAKTLDQAETTGSQVVGMMDAAAMELSVNPHIGGNFDMSV